MVQNGGPEWPAKRPKWKLNQSHRSVDTKGPETCGALARSRKAPDALPAKLNWSWIMLRIHWVPRRHLHSALFRDSWQPNAFSSAPLLSCRWPLRLLLFSPWQSPLSMHELLPFWNTRHDGWVILPLIDRFLGSSPQWVILCRSI